MAANPSFAGGLDEVPDNSFKAHALTRAA